ncbi:MAG: hypothetical protein PVF38_14135 [Desulfobacterales bacterium]|jgi:hypothetical protein
MSEISVRHLSDDDNTILDKQKRLQLFTPTPGVRLLKNLHYAQLTNGAIIENAQSAIKIQNLA